MRLRLQISIATAILILAALVLVGSNIYGTSLSRQAREEAEFARAVSQGVLELNILVGELRVQQIPRISVQFSNRIQSLENVLRGFTSDRADVRKIIQKARSEVEHLQTTFTAYKDLLSSKIEADHRERAQRVYIHSILSSSYGLSASSTRLSRIFEKEIADIESVVLWLNAGTGAFFLVVVFGLYGQFLSTVMRPLLTLRGNISSLAPNVEHTEAKAQKHFRNELEDLSTELSWRRQALEEAEAELLQRAEDLERSNRELEQFAYVASHDLQEPLRAVVSYSQLLHKRLQGTLDEKSEKFIHGVIDGASRMQRLIQALLTFSRVTTKGGDFKLVDCNEVVQAAIDNLEETISASGATVKYDALPTVVGDATQLTSVFQNLMSNAIKFRSEEPPNIQISYTSETDFWRFCVDDNGIGMEMDYADRIFRIFQRLHNRTEYPGDGVGLALCQRIVDRHAGEISVSSSPQKGATFVFTLSKALEPVRSRTTEQ